MAKLLRYSDRQGAEFLGQLDGERIRPLAGELSSLRLIEDAPSVALADVKLLAPVKPSKFIAVGPNYHAQLHGRPPPARPYYWLKPSTALLDPEGTLVIPEFVPMACHESELAIVISRETRRVSRDDAGAHILGYTCMNDATAGNPTVLAFLESREFIDGKILDSFAVLGPMIETELDTADLLVQCRVNGEVRQHHRTSDMIFPPHLLVSMISQVLTLLPGDVISTGAPPGVGKMSNGDQIEIEIEGIGILRHGVSGPN